MKRAAIWRGARATWWACTVPADLYEPNDPMPMRAPICDSHEHEDFPSHAEALAHALAAVGLDRPAEHREAP